MGLLLTNENKTSNNTSFEKKFCSHKDQLIDIFSSSSDSPVREGQVLKEVPGVGVAGDAATRVHDDGARTGQRLGQG